MSNNENWFHLHICSSIESCLIVLTCLVPFVRYTQITHCLAHIIGIKSSSSTEILIPLWANKLLKHVNIYISIAIEHFRFPWLRFVFPQTWTALSGKEKSLGKKCGLACRPAAEEKFNLNTFLSSFSSIEYDDEIPSALLHHARNASKESEVKENPA